MTGLKSKKSYFILLIIFCSGYTMKAQSQSSAGIRGLLTNLNRSEVAEPSDRLLGSILVRREANTSDSEMTKVRRAIDAGNAVWVAAWAKGDAEMLPGTFTSDGKELVAGGKVYKGRKQILALMRESMKKRGGRAALTVTTTDVWLDGNTTYETGTAVYEFTVNGQPQTLERRYFTIWKRESKNGAWKIYSNTGVAKE